MSSLVEYELAFLLGLRVKAESLQPAHEFGEDWLNLNLQNLLGNGDCYNPCSGLEPGGVVRSSDRGLGYFQGRANISHASFEEYTLKFECAGIMPGDPRGPYSDLEWIDTIEERIAFYRKQNQK